MADRDFGRIVNEPKMSEAVVESVS